MSGGLYSKLRRITSDHNYFPEIDGIRFLAIMLVLLFHGYSYLAVKSPSLNVPAGGYRWLQEALLNGDRGVELFFVLSGFILCLPFARHYLVGAKPVALKRYYLRRVTRLEPPYFIAMTGLMLAQLFLHIRPVQELLPSWLASLIYSHNVIFRHTPLITVVAWSLEIEIQFYILAPLLFRLLSLSTGLRRTALVLLTLLIVCLQLWYPAPYDLLTLYNFLQYFLIGILLADFYVSNVGPATMNSRGMGVVALMCLLAIIYLPLKGKLGIAQGWSMLFSRLAFPFVIGLFYYIIMKNNLFKRIFSFGFIPIIGGMCYSIYLLHYPIISFVGKVTAHWRFTGWFPGDVCIHLAIMAVPVLLISAVFYKYIERPFMSGKWLNMLLREPVKKD